jgi:hypothetical protein
MGKIDRWTVGFYWEPLHRHIMYVNSGEIERKEEGEGVREDQKGRGLKNKDHHRSQGSHPERETT